jgi:ATP-dependent Lon protease
MRDFRNAKAMAKTLREALAGRSFEISHSESLELIARILGCKNWQTLASAIAATPASFAVEEPSSAMTSTISMPVVPMRDIVVLPEMALPLFVGRAKTLRAIERAMTGDQRLLLVTQKREADDTPTIDDLHEVGVVAVILKTMRLPDGNMKVMVQAERRARLTRLIDGEMLEAEIETIQEPHPDEAGQALAQQALEHLGRFTNHDPAAPPIGMAHLPRMVGRPGLFADLITPLVATRLDQAQGLLETADPIERLKTLLALMNEEQKAA